VQVFGLPFGCLLPKWQEFFLTKGRRVPCRIP